MARCHDYRDCERSDLRNCLICRRPDRPFLSLALKTLLHIRQPRRDTQGDQASKPLLTAED